jgi:hypothetical protein
MTYGKSSQLAIDVTDRPNLDSFDCSKGDQKTKKLFSGFLVVLS